MLNKFVIYRNIVVVINFTDQLSSKLIAIVYPKTEKLIRDLSNHNIVY